MFIRIVASYIFILLLSLSAFDVLAQSDTGNENSSTSRYVDGEELILDVKTARYDLGQILSVIKGGHAYISLEDIFTVIDFPIAVSGNRFEGWFIDETNRFDVDFTLSKRTENGDIIVNIGEKTVLLSPDDYLFTDGLHLIRYKIFSDWFKLNMQIGYTDLDLLLDPESPLPFQIRLARQNSALNGVNTSKVARFPHLYRGYGILSPQSLDAQFGLSSREGSNNARYSILGKRDIGFVNTRFFLSGFDDDLIKHGRLTLSRESNENDLLGSLKASIVEVGDVLPVKINGVGNSSVGRGLFVSNRNLYQSFNLETVDLTGQIDVNWDVELYRNNVLIDKLSNVTSGQYEFLDISLFYGENNLVLKFYGPQGQYKEETYQQVIDKSTQLDRSFEYSFSLVDKNKDLFNTTISDELNSGVEFAGQYRFGLVDNITMRVAHSHTLNTINNINLFSSGLTGRLFESVIWNSDIAVSDNNFLRSQSAVRTIINGHNFALNYIFEDNNDEESQRVSFINNGRFDMGARNGISYQNNIKLSKTKNNSSEFSISNNIGFRAYDTNFYHQIEFLRKTDERKSSELEVTTGSVNIQKSIGGTLSRLGITYSDQLNQKFALAGVDANFSWIINDEWSTTFDYQYSKFNDSSTFKAGLEYNNGLFFVNSNFSYFDNDDWLLGINARISLSYNAQSDRIFSAFRSSVNTGTVFVRVFIDANENAKYDDGEYIVENAAVHSVQSASMAKTDENGVAFLTGLTNQKKTDIYVDTNKVEEPYLQPLLEGFSITPRAGVVETVDFPLVYYSEIGGSLTIEYLDGKIEDGTNYTIELVNDRSKKLVSQTRTEFDGYFFFDKVLPGSYTLRVGLNKRNLKKFSYKEVKLELTNVPLFIDNNDLKISEIAHLQGYVTVIAEFDSRKKALLYAKILDTTSAKPYLQQSALLGDVRKNAFSLATGYFSTRMEADAHCVLLVNAGLSCTPTSYTSTANNY